MTVPILPSFARVEIKIGNKRDLLVASANLRSLSEELNFIAGANDSEDDALILAHHRIRATSKKLREGSGS